MKKSLLLALALLVPCALRAAEALESQFQNPPEETKPYCYWYWLKSDITRDGITKDLEAMSKAGIRLAMIGNVGEGNHPAGPVKMFSPEWKTLTKHALAEAGRLGIEIYMFNCPGWSQSGGPWIKPEQSMRRVLWNSVQAAGGPFSAKVRNAQQDIAVLAVPKKKSVTILGVRPAELPPELSFVSASSKAVTPGMAKYVRVEIPSSSGVLSLAEVQVFSGGVNIAINGKSSQSSVGYGGNPERAIDNNTSGSWGDNSITHTDGKQAPWWSLELSQEARVEKIVIWNRTDGSVERLNNFNVSLLDGSQNVIWSKSYDQTPNPKLEIPDAAANWIWHPEEDGAKNAPAGTKYFRKVIQADPSTIKSARMMVSADDSFVLWINGQQVGKGSDWKVPQEFSIAEFLKSGANVIACSVMNNAVNSAGLIALLELEYKDGNEQLVGTDASWQVRADEIDGWRDNASDFPGWQMARVIGPCSTKPWELPGSNLSKILHFEYKEPWTARGLTIVPKSTKFAIAGKLYALDESGARTLVADIKAGGSNPKTDFLPLGAVTFSLKDTTAKVFEWVATSVNDVSEVTLSSDPVVAKAVEKQLGRMFPSPVPAWDSYIFPSTQQPADDSVVLRREEILNLTDKLDANGVLTCELPQGEWTILYFGMVTTGKTNQAADREATGLECDKMSKEIIRYHFHSMFDQLMAEMTPDERKAFKGITIDSYEVGSQNWTDGFDKTFAARNGYDPLVMLPILTGLVIDSAQASDGFLSDLRRTVADLIAENYIGGLREVAAENGLRTWCENYGHWGFPGEFLTYGGYADQIAGEFWTQEWNPGMMVECRAASSAAHIYGKQNVFAEAFTSGLDLKHHPYSIKKRGDEAFCAGINHFVLHVVAHQPRDGMPGLNPWFGTAFHRNTPWFNHSRNWVRYLQRCHFMLSQGEPVADTAAYIGDFAPQMTGPNNPVPPGYDYDFINSDALLRKIRVEKGEFVVPDEKDPARISTRYKMVAMPQEPFALQMRPKVRARIEELKKQGGLFVEGVPVTAEKMQELKISPLVSKETCPVLWKARRLDDGMIFFLAKFKQAGPFEVTLRASGKIPELFNPVTGETRKIARFWQDGDGTRVSLNVNDLVDSFFVVFRDKLPDGGSVVKSERDGQPVSGAELELYFDKDGSLIGEAAQPGNYTVTLSTGAQKQAVIAPAGEPLVIKDGWTAVPGQEAPNTLTQEVVFDLPEALAKAGEVKLDLGKVNVMATVTVNGKEFETLWMPPFTLDVTKALKAGQNRIKIEVVSTSPTTPCFGPEIQFKTILKGVFK